MATTSSVTTPAMAPPHGLQSNFVDPPTMMSIAVAGTAVIHLVTIPFVLARAYVNVFVSKKLHIEDYLCYLSYTGCIAYTAAIVYAESIGMARHMWDIPLSTFTEILYICNIVFVCYTATGGLAKTMVFLQLKKIFTTGAYDAVFWVIVVSLVANAIFYTAMLFLYIFTCWPREKIWNSTVEGHCLDSNKLNMAMGTLNVISDMEAFAVPVWAIWHLSMELKRKIGVFAVFSVGAVAVAIGTVGLYYRIVLLEQPDFSWLLTQAGLICMAELAIVIIVGCCPYVPRFLYSVGLQGAGKSDTADKRSSLPSKPTARLNTFDKYLTTRSGMTKLEPTYSEEHLEMHQYKDVVLRKPGCVTEDSADGR